MFQVVGIGTQITEALAGLDRTQEVLTEKPEDEDARRVNTIGPIRQLVRGEDKAPRRYLVILPGTADNHGVPVQVQME